jgi:mRNA interferase MazF
MTAGDIALTSLPQANGLAKMRPVLLLKQFPPFGNFLVCGISSQVQQEVAGFDFRIDAGSAEFAMSGLKTTSLVRPGFLAVLPESQLAGKLGFVSGATLSILLRRLSDYLANSDRPHSSKRPSAFVTNNVGASPPANRTPAPVAIN